MKLARLVVRFYFVVWPVCLFAAPPLDIAVSGPRRRQSLLESCAGYRNPRSHNQSPCASMPRFVSVRGVQDRRHEQKLSRSPRKRSCSSLVGANGGCIALAIYAPFPSISLRKCLMSSWSPPRPRVFSKFSPVRRTGPVSLFIDVFSLIPTEPLFSGRDQQQVQHQHAAACVGDELIQPSLN